MLKTAERMLLEQTILAWKALKVATKDHQGGCDCKECGNRRKTGAKLSMPYAGPVSFGNTSLRA